MLYQTTFTTPLGLMIAQATVQGIRRLAFADTQVVGEGEVALDIDNPQLVLLQHELGEYFSGTRAVFSVPLDPAGTDFQCAVWRELSQISFGSTVSYAHVARAIGAPRGSQAVGHANGQNRIAIVVPCHRVVGSSGKLTGYAGGIERKKWLLRHESASLF